MILKVENLTKHYNKFIALDNISFNIKKGSICGLVGANGSGKTTLMRIISGASYQTTGNFTLFNTSSKNKINRNKMGVLIEQPSFYKDMTAYQNLELLTIAKKTKKNNIDNILNIVGLLDVKNKKVGKFSLGMRQRLSIAMTLIGEPEFIILDEPINGLDPNGIIDIRNIIKNLNKEYGITFLISSHILQELYQFATDYVIINKSKLISTISQNELDKKLEPTYNIYYDGNEKELLSFLNNYNINIIDNNNNIISFKTNEILPKYFLKQLMTHSFINVDIYDFNKKSETLEEYFLRITKERNF